MFAVLAQLSENFIFIYLGLNLFTQDVQVFKPLFILVSAVGLFAPKSSETQCLKDRKDPC
jgi:sodium/hydrogen exchanger-like protein 6/7